MMHFQKWVLCLGDKKEAWYQKKKRQIRYDNQKFRIKLVTCPIYSIYEGHQIAKVMASDIKPRTVEAREPGLLVLTPALEKRLLPEISPAASRLD